LGRSACRARCGHGGQTETRLKEAAKLGFKRAILPKRLSQATAKKLKVDGLELIEIGHLQEMIDWLYNEVRSNALQATVTASRQQHAGDRSATKEGPR
jgi:hypothetical protein